jgi:hypothetical protein
MTTKRDDAEGWKKGVKGCDGHEGESFTRRPTDPWNSNDDGNSNSDPHGKYTNNDDAGLRNKQPWETGAKTRQILDEVEGQSDDDGNRAIRSRDSD